jgi:DNA-binding response OmpR family regulator
MLREVLHFGNKSADSFRHGGSEVIDRGCVVLLGDFSNERLDLTAIGHEFGWSVTPASDLSGLREVGRSRTVTAVLLKAGALGMPWRDALRIVRAAAPRARTILCHKADQARYRTEMIDAGAFGVLLSPLAHSEVRQSLGFIWASRFAPLERVPTTAKKNRPIEGKVRHVGAA